jgi:hypothetical protein
LPAFLILIIAAYAVFIVVLAGVSVWASRP